MSLFTHRTPRAPYRLRQFADYAIWVRPSLHTFRAYPKPGRSAYASTLSPATLVEEQKLRFYKPQYFYPVKIGETFHDRYKVIGKLGYGSKSTVWLCHVLLGPLKYVALKVYTNKSEPQRELPIYGHINGLQSDHHGQVYIRRLLDTFQTQGPHGEHSCLVHEALGMNLEELRELLPDGTFNPDLVRQCLRSIIRALHFLREDAHVVHTNVQPKNILLGVLDDGAFVRFERDEKEYPFPRQVSSGHTVHLSRPMPLTKGPPSLCDLSEARFDRPGNDDLVMPDLYRALEVILRLPWSYPIDVWGFAMTLWDLFEPQRLFSPRTSDEVYSEQLYLAQMAFVMGPPPQDMLDRSRRARDYWDANGQWRGSIEIPKRTLETAEKRLEGEEKQRFLACMRNMLQWRPEDRSRPEDIFVDEWFAEDSTV